MNKIALAIMFFILNVAPSVAQPIVSIGDLKVGMKESDFLLLPDIIIRSIRNRSNFTGSSNDIVWKNTNQTRNPNSLMRIYSPGYVEYEYQMGVGVKDSSGRDSYNVTVKFYNDEIFEISLDISASMTQFREVLTEKYGKPNFVDNMKKEICQNRYGAKSEHNTGSLIWAWGDKEPIDASVTVTSFDCGKYSGSRYTIKNNSQSIFVRSLERDAEKNAKNEEVKKKAASSAL